MKNITLFFVISLISGCVPITYEYYYLSFENISDVKVLAYGTSKISYLRSHESMPVLYELNRSGYKLTIEVDQQSKQPAVFIRAKNVDGQNLKVIAIPNNGCGGFDFLTVDIEDQEFLRYKWFGVMKSACKNKELSTNERMVTFQVMGQTDKILGEESLLFTLIRNGTFVEYDAI